MYNKDMTQLYLKALENPMPELKEAFDDEWRILNGRDIVYRSVILDVGCGAGRSLIRLAEKYPRKMFVGLDNDPEVLSLAKKNCSHLDNILFKEGDILDMPFDDRMFDLIYSSYNTIGSVDTQKMLSEELRVARDGTYVINTTWSKDDKTTEFLKRYYPSIGINIISIDENRTITDKGTFRRVDNDEVKSESERKGLGFPNVCIFGVWKFMMQYVWK